MILIYYYNYILIIYIKKKLFVYFQATINALYSRRVSNTIVKSSFLMQRIQRYCCIRILM